MCPADNFENECDAKVSCKECPMKKEGCKGCPHNRYDEEEAIK
jgi:sulfatase maturation enzyme AslB (radical SAM superfamily)